MAKLIFVSDEISAKLPQKPNFESKKIRILGENGINFKLKHRKAHNSILSGRFVVVSGRVCMYVPYPALWGIQLRSGRVFCSYSLPENHLFILWSMPKKRILVPTFYFIGLNYLHCWLIQQLSQLSYIPSASPLKCRAFPNKMLGLRPTGSNLKTATDECLEMNETNAKTKSDKDINKTTPIAIISLHERASKFAVPLHSSCWDKIHVTYFHLFLVVFLVLNQDDWARKATDLMVANPNNWQLCFIL